MDCQYRCKTKKCKYDKYPASMSICMDCLFNEIAELKANRDYYKMLNNSHLQELGKAKDKLHRRNMQIKDLKGKLGKIEDLAHCHFTKEFTTNEIISQIIDLVRE